MIKDEGEMHDKTLKEISFFSLKEICSEKKITNKTSGVCGNSRENSILFIFNSCLNKQIIYCLSKIQITLNKGFPYLVLKISHNMPVK
jgi:hypothetical protein